MSSFARALRLARLFGGRLPRQTGGAAKALELAQAYQDGGFVYDPGDMAYESVRMPVERGPAPPLDLGGNLPPSQAGAIYPPQLPMPENAGHFIEGLPNYPTRGGEVLNYRPDVAGVAPTTFTPPPMPTADYGYRGGLGAGTYGGGLGLEMNLPEEGHWGSPGRVIPPEFRPSRTDTGAANLTATTQPPSSPSPDNTTYPTRGHLLNYGPPASAPPNVPLPRPRPADANSPPVSAPTPHARSAPSAPPGIG